MVALSPSSAEFVLLVSTLVRELAVIDDELGKDRRASPEDQLKTPIHNFLMGAAELMVRKIRVVTEHRQTAADDIQGVRLDMAIKRTTGPLIGHVELKSSLKGANPYKAQGWSKHDKAQWKKLKNHSNLIYTNGWEWSLVRQGLKAPLYHVVLDADSQGNVPDNQLEILAELLTAFLTWKPTTPSSPRALADLLAPLTAFLRDSVKEVIGDNEDDALDGLYARWKIDFMPGATKAQFADSFAQTFTYALLLARVETDIPADEFSVNTLTRGLRRNGHKLLGAVLELMGQEQFRELVEDPISLLEATLGAVDSARFTKDTDPWLYFYEDFLAAYDPKMRKESGVYYTPVEIVRAQVRLVDHAIKTRIGRPKGLGDDSVNILDPAAGTATYPLAITEHVLKDSAAPQDAARSLSKRLSAFELLMGPYSVAHLRMTQALEATGLELDKDGVQVLFTNTLLAAGDLSQDSSQYALWHVEADLSEESKRAGIIKDKQTPVRVIIGNPPYKRGKRKDSLGTAEIPNVVLQDFDGNEPLINDFIAPLKALGAGGQAKNLYNLYVYFIRWALWKACQQNPQEPGVVSFITSSSYLRGPGFAGVREYMRRVFDEIWIIDLGGDNRGARKEENVFSIETPVAIFVGVQHQNTFNKQTGEFVKKRHDNRMNQKAQVYYQRVNGTRAEKLDAMNLVEAPDLQEQWVKLDETDWTDKFVPSSSAALSDGVPLESVFPWVHSGVQFKRKWPIATTDQALSKRWEELVNAPTVEMMRELVKETEQKSIDRSGENLSSHTTIEAFINNRELTEPVRYGYRSFDRQYCIPDSRFCDRPRPSLWHSYSFNQLYFLTLTSTALGTGPALTVMPYVPDLDAFRGSFGARSVSPLYRTATKSSPNISSQLIETLENTFGRKIQPEEIACYVMAQLGTSAFTERFSEDLAESPAGVIFTANPELFDECVEFGRLLIFEATWGERLGKRNDFGVVTDQRWVGAARCKSSTTEYPDSWSYDAETEMLQVADGMFTNVSQDVMAFEVSGMQVVRSWLGYRMKSPSGKSSSPLDQIQADTWTHDAELLELLWQVEFFISSAREASLLLDKVIESELISPKLIGAPLEDEVRGPKVSDSAQGSLEID
ncbi:type ISP restriction/modification enzyme [Corynebacterium macclintockiae]|uniref:type ISP restriction/modification enzyme n=1 Tax=Corynebacterium macclintockiae TaxID=2913501 RepID=UPI003EBC65B9